MGKGDKKTRKGKITMGSYGVLRPRKKSTGKVAAKAATAKAEKTETPKKAAAKKAAPKKAAKKVE